MMHPAALIEFPANTTLQFDELRVRIGRQSAVINAALEYFLADERADAAALSTRATASAFDLLLKRRGQRREELFKACDELLKLVPNVDRRLHPAKRKAVRA